MSKSAQRRPLRGETSNLAIRLLDTMQDFESRRGLPQPCSAEAAEVAIGPVEFTALFFRSRSRDGKHACASQFHPSLGTRRACTFRGQTPRASGRDLPPSPLPGRSVHLLWSRIYFSLFESIGTTTAADFRGIFHHLSMCFRSNLHPQPSRARVDCRSSMCEVVLCILGFLSGSFSRSFH